MCARIKKNVSVFVFLVNSTFDFERRKKVSVEGEEEGNKKKNEEQSVLLLRRFRLGEERLTAPSLQATRRGEKK